MKTIISILIIGILCAASNSQASKMAPIYRRELLTTRRGGSMALNRHFLRDKNQKTFYYLKHLENEDSNSDDDDNDSEYDDDDEDEVMERELRRIMRPKVEVKKSMGGSRYRAREEAALAATLREFKRDNKRSTPLRKLQGRFQARRKIMRNYFLNTTSFVHGDMFLGLGRTTSGILFGYFATIYFVYILSTTLLLFQRRKDPSLSKFPLWISHFFPAIMNSIIVVLGFIQHMFRAKYPCFLVMWTRSLLIPMYVVLIFEARSLNLIFEYHWNKRMQALLQASEPRSTIDETIIVLERPNPRKNESSSSTTTNEDWMWIKKHGMTATIIGIFIFQFSMTTAIQIFSPYYKIWPKMMVYRCAGILEMILPLLAFLMYTFVIPLYLFIQLKRINDSYGVRKDIYSAVTQAAWIFLLFSLLRHVFFIEKFIGYCPTGFALMISFGILHYHTVCAPLMRIYLWQWSRSRGVKKRLRKYFLLKRKIESYLFPRIFRIRIDKKKYNNCGLKAPEPLKANRNGDLRQRARGGNSDNPGNIPNNCSPADSRLDETASPAASISPIVPPDLKPPNFNQVLQDETLCELFERYTLLEFSRENLLFYRAVCSLRSTFAALPNGAAQIFLVEKSRSLASQFIHINAPAEINIPGPVRKRIESRLIELDVDLTLFDEAQREVFRLMQNWSYPRFLRTLPEAEIRRFNRKARRNSTTAHLDSALLSNAPPQDANNPGTSAAVPISTINNLQSQRSRALQHDYLATSVCSLTLPMNIANVSLSSSP